MLAAQVSEVRFVLHNSSNAEVELGKTLHTRDLVVSSYSLKPAFVGALPEESFSKLAVKLHSQIRIALSQSAFRGIL